MRLQHDTSSDNDRAGSKQDCQVNFVDDLRAAKHRRKVNCDFRDFKRDGNRENAAFGEAEG